MIDLACCTSLSKEERLKILHILGASVDPIKPRWTSYDAVKLMQGQESGKMPMLAKPCHKRASYHTPNIHRPAKGEIV